MSYIFATSLKTDHILDSPCFLHLPSMFSSWGNAKNKGIPPVSFAHCFPSSNLIQITKTKKTKHIIILICSLQEGPYFGCTSNILVAPSNTGNTQQCRLSMQWFWTGPVIFLDWPKDSFLFFKAAQEHFWTRTIMFLGFGAA